MYIMFVLIGFSLLVALTFLGLYLWAVRTGQFDDKYTPSVRMLFDDGTKPREKNDKQESGSTGQDGTDKRNASDKRDAADKRGGSDKRDAADTEAGNGGGPR